MQRTIRALHVDTFFKLPHQQNQVETHIGTRPGDSFADVIFGFLLSKVLQLFQQQMGELGLLTKIPIMDKFSLQGSGPE